MIEVEGVIKYRLQFTLDVPPCWEDYPVLESWRRVLFHLRLTGLDPSRYEGLAYGNVSQRLPNGGFVISATQTGGIERLEPEHYCLVESADPAANLVIARGRYPPSSEALTHAAVYQASPMVKVVIHGHCPEIWRWGEQLALRHTREAAAYGTPAMAQAVMDPVRNQPERGMMVMRGHPDGVLSYAGLPRRAAFLMIVTLARVWSLDLGGTD